MHVSSNVKVEQFSRSEEETRDLVVREGRAFQEEKAGGKGWKLLACEGTSSVVTSECVGGAG